MGYLQNYKEQALNNLVNRYASFLLEGYQTAEKLEEAIQNGSFDGNIYQEGKKKPVATFRLEKNEGKYCIFEGSIWIVAWYDLLSRFYHENKKFFDSQL